MNDEVVSDAVRKLALRWLALHQRAMDNGCVEWTGARDQDGYGIISIWNPNTRKPKTYRAHRLIWEEHNSRRLEAGEIVRHRCDNPSCVYHHHLEVGSTQDNVADRVARGRTARGPSSGKSRFSVEDVVAIREAIAAGESSRSLAARYGCSLSGIEHIKFKRVWLWL